MARSDTFAPADLPDAAAWLDRVAEGRPATGCLTTDAAAGLAVAAAAESAGTIFGVILVAAPIDDGWATLLRDAVDADIVVVAGGGIAGSSLPRTRLPWRTAAEVPAGLDRTPVDLELTGERFQALAAALEPDGPRRVIVLQSRDQALAPYRSLQLALLAIGAVAAALGLLGSAWLARSITAPVPRLVAATQEVARGNFDVRLDIARDDEIGQLAGAFNRMTAGLRERADMAKFVSASTVEMIRRRPDTVPPGGERRTITVLFADIRGFTAFAGSCPPERAVSMLNRYLSLQADLVKRFNGDVDSSWAMPSSRTSPATTGRSTPSAAPSRFSAPSGRSPMAKGCRSVSASPPATSWSAASAAPTGWTTRPSAGREPGVAPLCRRRAGPGAARRRDLRPRQRAGRRHRAGAARRQGLDAPVAVYAMAGRARDDVP